MRVLVVEDQPKMRLLLCRGLREGGYSVDSVPDGPAALDQVTRAAYDAIVLDVMLPGLDGIEVLRRLRDAERWTPVLLLTARDAVADRVTGAAPGSASPWWRRSPPPTGGRWSSTRHRQAVASPSPSGSRRDRK